MRLQPSRFGEATTPVLRASLAERGAACQWRGTNAWTWFEVNSA
jgi:hypothetical protein